MEIQDDIKYIGPIPQNYVVNREVCGDDENIYFNKYIINCIFKYNV